MFQKKMEDWNGEVVGVIHFLRGWCTGGHGEGDPRLIKTPFSCCGVSMHRGEVQT